MGFWVESKADLEGVIMQYFVRIFISSKANQKNIRGIADEVQAKLDRNEINGFRNKQVKTSAPLPSHFVACATQLTPTQYTKFLAILAKEESNGSSAHLINGFRNKQVKTSAPLPSHFVACATQLTPTQYTKFLAILAKEESNGSSAYLVVIFYCIKSIIIWNQLFAD
ncbi:hypothetical protein LWI28_002289 [Acer negundo]|uniref:Uncharacterized protein n=1 Tax=Acer negundo TaxID=4023 RepID=A0AAD5INV8_ACENE|nr:hypothetical protein LWI28_002289 [Acer negundo]